MNGLPDFRKTYKATVRFNDAGGADEFLKYFGQQNFFFEFAPNSKEPTNELSIRMVGDGMTPTMEIVGHSLGDKPRFKEFFEDMQKVDDFTQNTLCIESIEIQTPSQGRKL